MTCEKVGVGFVGLPTMTRVSCTTAPLLTTRTMNSGTFTMTWKAPRSRGIQRQRSRLAMTSGDVVLAAASVQKRERARPDDAVRRQFGLRLRKLHRVDERLIVDVRLPPRRQARAKALRGAAVRAHPPCRASEGRPPARRCARPRSGSREASKRRPELAILLVRRLDSGRGRRRPRKIATGGSGPRRCPGARVRG